jgi:hypothetical protein
MEDGRTHFTWSPEVIIISDTFVVKEGFLGNQHLLVMLRTQDGDQPCGEEVQ